MEARDVIIAPLITEKSMAGTAVQQYSFEVNARATKTQIKSAVAEIFGVTVVKINTINVGGTMRAEPRKMARKPASNSNVSHPKA